MTIKDMERQVGVTKANIRFYEKEGLLSPARGENNYREYTDEDREVLEKIKYLRMLGVTVSDIRQFQQGKRSLSQLLKEREYQLKEEEAALNRMKLVCLELKKRDWDFQTLDTGLFDLQMKVLERRGAERMKKDRTEPVIKLRRIVWFFAMGGIASLVFFPVNSVLRIPVSETVITVWTLCVTVLALAASVLQAAAAGHGEEETEKRKRGEMLVKRAENRRLRYEKQIVGLNQICLASLFVIPFNRMLEIQWPLWLTAIWFVLVFGSAIAVVVVKNI
ncbi:MerR family transcriptional regulator [Hungatella hathewayi]|uniref:MerR family transcriptional regulator n=1 Tax=Hungatella hathewayi TaxID=154046 RepID=UPI003569A845